jgi:hypothetical protein
LNEQYIEVKAKICAANFEYLLEDYNAIKAIYYYIVELQLEEKIQENYLIQELLLLPIL